MPDIAHWWGSDLSVAADGDVAQVDASTLGTQRLLRRLLTNPGDYLWQPEYGAGLPGYIGKAVPPAAIVGVIRSQIFLEACVARQPDPVITVTPDPSGAFGVSIRYVDATTGGPMLLNFDVAP